MPTNGNDSIEGGPGNDAIDGLGGNDTINGRGGDDSLIGGSGDDLLNGGDGKDTLLGGGGADLLVVGAFDAADGGDGDDLLFVSSTTSNPAGWYNLSDPTATATQLAVFATNVERWAFEFGNADDTVIGSGSDDAVAARAGNDRIEGLGGNDTLIAGSGTDLVAGGDGDDVLITGAGSISPRRSQVGGIPASGYQPGWAWVFESDLAVDSVSAGNGNDLIVFDHIDSIDGGAGIDTVIVMARGFTNSMVLDMAVGDISSALSTVLGTSISNVEVVREFYSGSGSDRIDLRDNSLFLPPGAVSSIVSAGIGLDTVTGSAGAEQIRGDSGNDRLIGGGGADTISGGINDDLITGGDGSDVFDLSLFLDPDFFIISLGNDTITDFSPSDDVMVGFSVPDIALLDGDNDGFVDDTRLSFAGNGSVLLLDVRLSQIGGNANDMLIGGSADETILGNLGSDRLSGAAGDDALYGGPGDDTLDGGAGFDMLDGGSGAGDVATYQSMSSHLVLLLDQGIGGSAEVGFDFFRGMERFHLGSGADIVVGSTAADSVDGGAGDDWVSLGAGDDTLDGGVGGNDILVGGDGADLMIGGAGDQFYGDDGVDTVSFGGLTTGIAISVGAGWTAQGHGPGASYGIISGAEVVWTGTGDDSVYGFAGLRSLGLGAGNDLAVDYSNTNNDAYFGDAGDDALYGLGGNDLLDGGAGIDIIVGDAGDDTIIGGDGFDWMAGGAGADVFRYTAISHSRASTGTDAISDFTRGADTIDLAGIDANTLLAGDQAFTIGALQAGQAGRLQITLDPGGTPAWALVQGDVDGDGVADFDLLVFGPVAGLTGTDFVL